MPDEYAEHGDQRINAHEKIWAPTLPDSPTRTTREATSTRLYAEDDPR